jgi:PAS domain S-box-containing protein
MDKPKQESDRFEELRRRAEELLASRPREAPESAGQDILALIHELEVQQVELEIQNEELRRTQIALEDERRRYFDLFDLAPVGYVVLNEKGVVTRTNLAAVTMLGVERQYLLGSPFSRFVTPERQGEWREHLNQALETSGRQMTELKLIGPVHCGPRPGGPKEPLYAQMVSTTGQDEDGNHLFTLVTMIDITQRHLAEEEKDKLIVELKQAMATVKKLSGLLPICANCKKIRDDHGYWNQVEVYVRNHSDAQFSHGICPECMKKLYPEYEEKMRKDNPELLPEK